MTVKPNGTDAKEIALHFIELTVGRATPAIVSKTITQAKILLQSGYTKQEIIDVINYVIDVKHVHMYSLGYVNSCINNILNEIKINKEKEEAIKQKEEIKQQMEEQQIQQNEVIEDGESTQRNRDKLNRFGVKPGLREKFNLDMLKG